MHAEAFLRRYTRSAVPETRLGAVAALSPVANITDPEGPLQVTPVALGRSLTISPYPRRPVLVTMALDWCRWPAAVMGSPPPVTCASVPRGKLAAAVVALPRAENFPYLGEKVAAKTTLPWDSFPKTDVVIIVAPSLRCCSQTRRGCSSRRLRKGDLGRY